MAVFCLVAYLIIVALIDLVADYFELFCFGLVVGVMSLACALCCVDGLLVLVLMFR